MNFSSEIEEGTVYWVTGLSGAGKTTLGRLLRDALNANGRKVVLLDGDAMRSVMDPGLGHSRADRLKLATSYSRLCALLSQQGFDVVCATISLFHQVHDWNRENISHYREILLKASIETLKSRDTKGVYRKNENVAGVDLEAEFPKNPDVVVNNGGTLSPEQVLDRIRSKLGIAAA